MNVLAHHMVHIAERLAFVGDDAAKAALVRRAHSQWDHQPQYQWVEMDEVITTRKTISVSRLQQETFFHIPDEAVESRCTSCGVRLSVEVLSSQDGCCEACSVSYDLDLDWPAMDDVVSAGKTLHRTDSQMPDVWPPQGFVADPANESIYDMLDMDADPIDSKDTIIAPGVSKHWSNEKEMALELPEASTGSGFPELLHGSPGVGKTMTSESISEHYFTEFDIYSSANSNKIYSTPRLGSEKTPVAYGKGRSYTCLKTKRVVDEVSSSDWDSNESSPPDTMEIPVSDECDFGNDFAIPASFQLISHSIIRSNSSPDDSNRYKLLV